MILLNQLQRIRLNKRGYEKHKSVFLSFLDTDLGLGLALEGELVDSGALVITEPCHGLLKIARLELLNVINVFVSIAC